MTYKQSCELRTANHLIFDNTRVSDYDRCARFFIFRHGMGYESTHTAQALAFGHAMHKALETYYKLKLFSSAAITTEVLVLATLARFREDYEEVVPLPIQQDPRTSDKAYEIIQNYANTYINESLTIESPELIELGFTVPLPNTDIMLTGRIDALCTHPQLGRAVLEHKTATQMGKTFQNMFRPNNQISGYVYGARFYYSNIYGAIVNGIQVAKTKGELIRIPTSRSDDELTQYLDELRFKINRILEDTIWPMNTNSCTYYGSCKYRDLCISGKHLSYWLERATEPPDGYIISFWEPWSVDD